MGDIYDPLNPTEEDDIELSPEPTPSVPVQSRPTPGLQSAGLQAPQRTGAVRNSKIDLKNKSRQKICFSIAPNKILKLRPLAIANEAENLWEEKNLSLSTQEGSDMNAPSTSSQAPAVGSEGDLPSPDAQLSQSFTPPKEFKIEWNKMHYKKAHLIGNVARSVDQKPDGANAGGVDVSGGDDETSKAVVNTEAAETGDKLVLAEISSDSELTPVQPVSSVVIAAEIIVKDPPDATELTLTTKESNSQQTGNAQKSGQIIEVLQNSERCKIVSYRNIKVDVQSQKVKRKASRWDIPKDAEKPGEQTIDSPLNKDALSSNVLAPKTSDSLVGTMQSCLPTTVVDASIIDESKEAVLDSAPEHKTASVASACSDVISSSQFEQPTQDDVISEEMCLSIEENNDTSLNQPVQFQISTENDVPPEPHVSVTESTKCNEQADDEKDMTESCSSHSLSASRTSSPTRSAQADPTLPLACSMDDESTHKSDTESDSEDESDGEYRYPRVKLQSVVVVPATSLAAAAEGDSRTPSIVHQSDSSSKDSSDVDEMHKTSDKVTESDSTDGGESPECQPTNDEVAEHHLDSSKADTVQTSENKEIHGVDVEEPQNKQDKGTCKPDKNNDTVEKSQEQDHVELEKEINADDLEDTEMPDASDDVSNVEHTSVIDDEKTKSIPDKETVHVNEISPPPCVTKQTLDVENKELATLEVYISTSGENDCLTPAADEKHVGQSTEVVIGSIDTSGNDPSVVKSESIDIVDEAQIDPLQTSNIGTLSHPISEKCQENKDDSKIVKSQTQEVRSKDGLEMQHKSVSKSDTKSEKQETSCKVLGTVEKTNVQGSSKERSERSGDGKQGSRDVSSRQRNSLDRQRKSQERSSGQSKAQESVSQRGSSKEKSDAHRRSDRSRSRDCTERSRDRVRRPSRSREHASRRSRSRNRMEKRSRSRERASRRSRSRNRSDRSRDRQERRSRSKDRPERRSRSKNRSDRLRDWPDRRSRSRDRSDRRSRSRDRLDRRSRSRNRSDKVRDVVDRRSRSRGRARRSRERVERRSRSRDRSDRRSRSRDRTERLDKRSRSRDRTDRRGRFIERTRGRSRDRTDRRSHSRDRNPRAHSKERGGGGGRSRSRDRGDRHTSFRSERRQSPTHHEPSKTSSQSSQNHARDAPEKRDSGDKSGHPTSSSCSNSNAENRHSSHKASESSSSKQHSASGVSDRKSMEEKSSSHMTTKQEGSYKTQSWVPESRHAPHQEQTGAKTNSGPAFDSQSGLLKSHESSHQQINNPTQQAGNMLMQPDRWSTTKPNQDFFLNSQNVCQYSEVAYQFNTPYCQTDFPVNHISQDELYYNQQLGLNMINMHFQHGPGMAGGNALLAGQAHPHQGPMPFNQQMLHSTPSNNFSHKTLLPNPRGNNLEVPSLIKEVPSLIKTEKPNSDLELSSKRDKCNENEQDSNKKENENNLSRDTAKKEVKDESKLQQGKTPKSRRRRVISDSESDSETDSGDAKLDGTTDGEINKQTEVFEELNWPMENFEDAAKWKAMAAEGRMPSYFDILGENHYLSERKKSKSHRDIKKMKCECSMSEEEREQGLVACGEDCLNRLLMIECSSRCPTGELCTNRRFQKREYAKVEVFKTDKKGWGLRTSVDLQAGTFVLEYCGEVLDYKEFKTRAKEYARNKNIHFYFMALKNEEIIDATLKGNCSRFMNHSCDPNCETQKWTVNGQLRVGFFSRRLVPAGTELTFDYQFQRYGKEAQKCFCGSANCRGVLGGENRTSVRSSVGKGQRTKEKDRTRKKDSNAHGKMPLYIVPAEHMRKSTLEKHWETTVPKYKLDQCEQVEGPAMISAQHISEVELAKRREKETHRLERVLQLVQAFAAANIPLNKMDHPVLHKFLEQNLKIVGIIPQASALRSMYLPKVYEFHMRELKEKLGQYRHIAIVTDETTDIDDRYVLNIIAVPSLLSEGTSLVDETELKAYLIESRVLERTNFKTVSEAVLRATQKASIDFDKVSAFVTDHATYIYKAWERSLKAIFPNAVHVTCTAHILSLVSEIWQNKFEEVHQLIVALNNTFTVCPARKFRFRNFLKGKGVIPTTPPVFVMTRWNTLFDSADYLREHLHDCIEFFKCEQKTSGSLVMEGIIKLAQSHTVQEQLEMLDTYTTRLRQTLAKCESTRSMSACVFDELRDLALWAQTVAELAPTTAADALFDSATRLRQYLDFESPCCFSQPAARFLSACRVFDPAKARVLPIDLREICNSIPLLEDSVAGHTQLRLYLDNLSNFVPTAPVLFWRNLSNTFPELSRVALACLSIPLNNVDAERNFSKYSHVLVSEVAV
ncbi:histone-lysine N-methyltransferase SETD2 isoform X4 [Lampetra planeri]